jgi:hypothetical protein
LNVTYKIFAKILYDRLLPHANAVVQHYQAWFQSGKSTIETRQRFRQGYVLSTLLFYVVLEVIVRQANLQTTGSIYNKETQLLAYADDTDIVGRSQSAVRDAYLALKREAKVGLKINEKKTKYIIVARNDRTICDGGQSVAIGDKHFEVVKEFVYLGSLMTPKNDWNYNEESRLQIGASSDCANICSRATFHARQNLPSVGVDQKGGIARI